MKKEYIKHKKCRFCNSKNVIKTIDLGKMPLAGGFIKDIKDFKNEKKYPLDLLFCKECYLLQTSVSINPDILFKKYFYFSSSITTLVEHFDKVAIKAKKMLNKNDFVVEIGCNDGEFLKALKRQNFKALGVDPANNVVKPLIKKGAPIINAYFNNSIAKKIVNNNGNADAIYSFHSLAHITEMHEVASGIKTLLKPDGYLAFEVHYLGNLIEETQYDMIYHEHLHYYSLLSIRNFFRQYDMEVFNVERNNLRAGSIIFYLQNINGGKRNISINVKKLETEEIQKKFDKPDLYLNFNKKIFKTKKDLNKVIDKLIKQNKIVAGYGASGRGTVILNYCNLGIKRLKFVVDDAPAKHGSFMPGTHNPVYPSNKLVEEKVDYAVVFAWPFIKEVLKKNQSFTKKQGKFILPLPDVKIIE